MFLNFHNIFSALNSTDLYIEGQFATQHEQSKHHTSTNAHEVTALSDPRMDLLQEVPRK